MYLAARINICVITLENILDLFPRCKNAADFVSPLNDACQQYGITTKARLAAFIAQVGHESAGLTALRENLNYSAVALRVVFPKYFTSAVAANYERKPERIANRVYANRMGNGDEASGDGWRYRGAGLIQLTGRDNHEAFAEAIGKPLAEVSDYLATAAGGSLSAAWFWSRHGCNELADANRFTDITHAINGGLNGIDARTMLWTRCRTVLK